MSSKYINKTSVDSYPDCKSRLSSSARPIIKIVSRYLDNDNFSVVSLHTAGENYVYDYRMIQIKDDNDLLAKMNEEDSKLIKWVVNTEKSKNKN